MRRGQKNPIRKGLENNKTNAVAPATSPARRKGREEKRRERKGKEGKEGEGKGSEGKGREGGEVEKNSERK